MPAENEGPGATEQPQADSLNPRLGPHWNDDNRARLKSLLLQVSELLLAENHVRGGDWTFDGWTADGRPVRHKFRLDGYARTGRKVEQERAARRAAGLRADGPPCPFCGRDDCKDFGCSPQAK